MDLRASGVSLLRSDDGDVPACLSWGIILGVMHRPKGQVDDFSHGSRSSRASGVVAKVAQHRVLLCRQRDMAAGCHGVSMVRARMMVNTHRVTMLRGTVVLSAVGLVTAFTFIYTLEMGRLKMADGGGDFLNIRMWRGSADMLGGSGLLSCLAATRWSAYLTVKHWWIWLGHLVMWFPYRCARRWCIGT